MKQLTEEKKEEKRKEEEAEAVETSHTEERPEEPPQDKKPQEIKMDSLRTQEARGAADDKKAAELAEKLKATEDKYLRLCAEFDNFRKRTEAERIDQAKHAAGKFIEAVLPVLDSFERSQKTLTADADTSDEVKKGFTLIHKQLEDILQKFGVTKMAAVGQPFDPRLHEALLQKESEQPPQTVLEEYQTGYLLHDKVLRHAQVVVAK
ncbi:molecular chaperone GrpE [Candidatus Termititenax persephonae]|uniref:Protein GrpE n=1 Tax=Candidatus Termititenax persephonae TaxID=2218525 RepID=A0A388TH53_9BACT|nr:molecular chaperone GrpE [Candidatus Termititenax persephonae]